MTKKLKLFKGIFLSFMSVLSLAMALHNFVCIEETYLYNPNLSQPISYKFYGANYSIYGDIQHSIADVGNNVDKLSEHVTWMGEEIFSSMLSGFAFVFLLVFFVCLYLAIKTFLEISAEKTKKSIVNDVAEIEYFNTLKERGLISEEEYALKKKQILGI